MRDRNSCEELRGPISFKRARNGPAHQASLSCNFVQAQDLQTLTSEATSCEVPSLIFVQGSCSRSRCIPL